MRREIKSLLFKKFYQLQKSTDPESASALALIELLEAVRVTIIECNLYDDLDVCIKHLQEDAALISQKVKL